MLENIQRINQFSINVKKTEKLFLLGQSQGQGHNLIKIEAMNFFRYGFLFLIHLETSYKKEILIILRKLKIKAEHLLKLSHQTNLEEIVN